MNKQRRKKVEGVFDQLQAMIMELEETLIKWIFSTSQAKRKSLLLWRIC